MMSYTMVSLATFVAVTFCIIGMASLAFDVCLSDRARHKARIRAAFHDEMRRQAQESPLFRDLRNLAANDLLPTETLGKRLQTWIDQSGIRSTPWQLLLISVSLTLVAYGVSVWIRQSIVWPLPIVLVTFPAPWLWVNIRRAQRRRLMCRQLPDAFDVMSRALRAGQSVQTAFQVVASEFPAPITQEFAFCYEQQHLGMAPEVALRDLARRTNIMELQIFVVGMIVALRTGGNLAELLSKLSQMTRNRIKLQSRLLVLTGEGRMQAIVLASLPVLMFVVLWVTNREYTQILLDRPYLLLGCIASQACGAIWIRRLTNINL